jgi:lycopene beta-cyclase
MKRYDYILVGAGAAGMQLLAAFCRDPFFSNHSILVIDADSKTANDRTWCWWERGEGMWGELVEKRWDKVSVVSGRAMQFGVEDYPYNMLHSAKFYAAVKGMTQAHGGIDWAQERYVKHREEQGYVEVITENNRYEGTYLFTSIADLKSAIQSTQHPYLHQHFIGWFVKTEHPVFEADSALMMDFSVEQRGNTRFMYVLPTSPQEALVEYTLFSDTLLSEREYEQAISEYLEGLQAGAITIQRKEQGAIPMTTYPFWKHNTTRVLHIGIAGGWTRASTGYTFYNSTKESMRLVGALKSGLSDMRTFHASSRFHFYDFVVLDVLKRRNDVGSAFFGRIFETNPIHVVFDFLNGQSTLIQEVKIIARSRPRLQLVYSVLRYVWGRLGFPLYKH